MKMPSTKSQIPNKLQCTKYEYPNGEVFNSDIGTLELFGVWILGFGI
jgi:hypothetical protein